MDEKLTINAIFCEDVRPEISGQWTLVGVYPGVAYIERDGVEVISNWIKIDGLTPGPHSLRFKAQFKSEEGYTIFADRTIDIESPNAQSALILTPTGLTVAPEESGWLTLLLAVDAEIEREQFREIARLRIQITHEDDVENEENEEE